MKLRLLLLALLTAIAVRAADSVPFFNAVLTMGKENRFVLAGLDGKASGWLSVGDTFADYTIKSFDTKTSVLKLEHDGKTVDVNLVDAAGVKNAPAPATAATLADAQAVLNKMHFEEMLERSLAQQKKSMAAMVDQMAAQMKFPGGNRDDFVAFQKKMMDEMMSSMDIGQLKDDMTHVYSEVFSKDELDAMSAFYSTPLGESLNQKQPEVQQKLTALITPRLMQMMPKIQQMAQDFAREQKAKAATAAASAAPAPAAP